MKFKDFFLKAKILTGELLSFDLDAMRDSIDKLDPLFSALRNELINELH